MRFRAIWRTVSEQLSPGVRPESVSIYTHMQRNERKILVLRTLRRTGPLLAKELAVRAGIYPVRRAYWYFARLAKWDLIRRSRDRSGRWLYRISEKGAGRLAWLEAQR